MVVRAWQESSMKKCSMILIVMMKPQRIMLSNNLLEVGKYSNMEDELCGVSGEDDRARIKNSPKNLVVSPKTLIFADNN